jgi:hypothetical protein
MQDMQIVGYLRGTGPEFLQHLLETFKNRAKSIARAVEELEAPIGLMRIQEALAKTLGFPNMHGLQTCLKRLSQEYGALYESEDWRVAENWLKSDSPKAASSLMGLGEEFCGIVPLREELRTYLEDLAEGLAEHLEQPSTLIRDALARAWAGEDGWKVLLHRTPLNRPSNEPMLTFSVLEDEEGRPYGRFEPSEEADWIRDNEISDFESVLDGSEMSRADSMAALLRACGQAEKYPLILDAWLIRAQVIDRIQGDEGFVPACESIETGIKTAERLIPRDFKGPITWDYHENRPYHRLLHAMLEKHLYRVLGAVPAKKLALKILRLNPSDNLGVRCQLPMILALTANEPSPRYRTAVKRALETGGISGELNVGVSKLSFGDVGGIRNVVSAIYNYPVFGAELFDVVEDSQEWPGDLRGDWPETYQAPWSEILAIVHALCRDAKLSSYIRSILSDSVFQMEERHLRQLVGDNKPRDRDVFEERRAHWPRWHEELPQAIEKVSRHLQQTYPMPA